MALSFGKNKNKSTGSQTQQFSQTENTRLSDRAYAAFTDRAATLGQQQYQGLAPDAYKQFENPYQQEVIDATTADINAQRALAENQQRSDMAGQQAFGDKRRGIREAELTGQYDRTLATTTAGLRSRGYEHAQGLAQGENTNRNQYDMQTQALLNQLYALLGNETTSTRTGNSSGTSKGSQTGYNLGMSWSPAKGFNA